ncbi:hypothetical protein NLJ89_g10787 [Agrocybe chaxingu]|uniref:DDE-1 domain-containing protein n=1 Tax=Agrocybe chaxingu TaxID=84603 RepID=A0A9W8JPY2_9AGAR|nr:hypothetical protein NLJ89_g10787 [Agrocybe chaxingu]
MHAICSDFEKLYFNETGKIIKLSHSTLSRLAQGGHTIQQANTADKGLLTQIETNCVIDFIIKYGVGKNWTHHFAKKNSACIKVSWVTALEEKWDQGANPHANEAWWNLLCETLTKYNIKPENIYGVDEVGIQAQGGEQERVFGSQKKTPQYQQCAGSRENITVLVTICADGTSQAPAVIFKGSTFQMNCRISYQKKGWTDGEIRVEWIKIFEKEMLAKVAGEWRLLLVDGHNSHYTLGFLQHAHLNQIIILCYPAHTTHIYQGLDVIIFAVLKHFLSKEQDKWLCDKGKKIDKTNFLSIYGQAHVHALSRESILAAFHKTGVHPFNPDVITENMLAPAKESSMEGHLPLPPPTPVPTPGATPSETPTNTRQAAIEDVLKDLSKTDLTYLFSSLHLMTSSDPMATTCTAPISTTLSPFTNLSIIPKTQNKIVLLAALEEKKENDKMKGKLIGNGLPKMLTGDDFYEHVVKFTKWQREQEQQKMERKEAAKSYKEELSTWKVAEEAQKERNKEISMVYHEALDAWEEWKAAAKAAGKACQFKEPRPKMGPRIKATPKPKRVVEDEEVEEGGSKEEADKDDEE